MGKSLTVKGKSGLTYKWSGLYHTVNIFRGGQEVDVLTAGDQSRDHATRAEIKSAIKRREADLGFGGHGGKRKPLFGKHTKPRR